MTFSAIVLLLLVVRTNATQYEIGLSNSAWVISFSNWTTKERICCGRSGWAINSFADRSSIPENWMLNACSESNEYFSPKSFLISALKFKCCGLKLGTHLIVDARGHSVLDLVPDSDEE
jgi:hypothetical protein